ncbi:MAG: cysteine desulfurase NifS [Candidatus Taylorbacteria bacterium CG10_big_fil_rev_8_21_14_0_10_41_48]|uniref:Cysteine desulfurase NifS n=1 Tax=Candidatus Taylorbacteria bacterium CG10_big_fil_rev_8_21_14_0_10_41_48 TaxID=1975024 RepID=A0A2M8LBW7_9BACT|nr:MAG: cysteine desulfurase NifS [Candidatus Taylorbacteria bacterium CG10_big_fil_rev_8_21_14_0_10_41_48]
MANMFGKKRIYLDYAAATPVLRVALKAQTKAYKTYANPSAIHKDGIDATALLEESRKSIALFLACKSREVVFVSGGTESNNLAILGFAQLFEKKDTLIKNSHWITAKIEHPSTLECFRRIESMGASVTYLKPNEDGSINPSTLEDALRKETVFVSIGWANSEIGVIQRIRKLAEVIKTKNKDIIFHTDAGQAPLYLSSIVQGLGVDLLTLDSGKMYGPRGVGVLYKKSSVNLAPLFYGGSQEYGLRPGSENVSLAVGFSKAIEEMASIRKTEAMRLESIREYFIKEVKSNIKEAVINGEGKMVLPNIVSVSIPNIDNEYIALALDRAGISISTKSSCLEGESDASYVIEALGVEKWRAQNALRFSFGTETSKKDVYIASKELNRSIRAYRNLT